MKNKKSFLYCNRQVFFLDEEEEQVYESSQRKATAFECAACTCSCVCVFFKPLEPSFNGWMSFLSSRVANNVCLKKHRVSSVIHVHKYIYVDSLPLSRFWTLHACFSLFLRLLLCSRTISRFLCVCVCMGPSLSFCFKLTFFFSL